MLATGFWLGRSPKAPGTVGSLLGFPLAYLFCLLGPYGYMTATFLFAIFAMIISQLYLVYVQTQDPQEVVIDEVAGMLIALTWVPFHPLSWGMAFLLFRILDATKPGPIGVVDSKIKGGVGVVADDLVAGLFANLILQIMFSASPNWWGFLPGGLHGF
jgi:phosphatidylglycerophosphatase A